MYDALVCARRRRPRQPRVEAAAAAAECCCGCKAHIITAGTAAVAMQHNRIRQRQPRYADVHNSLCYRACPQRVRRTRPIDQPGNDDDVVRPRRTVRAGCS